MKFFKSSQVSVLNAISHDLFGIEKLNEVTVIEFNQEGLPIGAESIKNKGITEKKDIIVYASLCVNNKFDTELYKFILKKIEEIKNETLYSSLGFIVDQCIYFAFFNDRKLYEKVCERNKVSVLIPALNEELTVEKIVKTTLESPLTYEVIAVNDGSSDRTYDILSKISHSKYKFINFPVNKGKGAGVSALAKEATGDIVLMVDADLFNFKTMHLEFLVTPLFLRSLNIKSVLGIRGAPKKLAVGTLLTGERAYYRSDFNEVVDEVVKTRYGIETILNSHFENQNTIMVPLIELRHPMKYEKDIKLTKVAEEYVKASAQILYAKAKLQVKKMKIGL